MASGTIKKNIAGRIIDNFVITNNESHVIDFSNYPYSTALIVSSQALYAAFISDRITNSNAIVENSTITMTTGVNELTFSTTSSSRRFSVIVFDWP